MNLFGIGSEDGQAMAEANLYTRSRNGARRNSDERGRSTGLELTHHIENTTFKTKDNRF